MHASWQALFRIVARALEGDDKDLVPDLLHETAHVLFGEVCATCSRLIPPRTNFACLLHMTATALSAATLGIDAYLVHVEVDTDRQLPSFTPPRRGSQTAPCAKAASASWPQCATPVSSGLADVSLQLNLAPADVRKETSP